MKWILMVFSFVSKFSENSIKKKAKSKKAWRSQVKTNGKEKLFLSSLSLYFLLIGGAYRKEKTFASSFEITANKKRCSHQTLKHVFLGSVSILRLALETFALLRKVSWNVFVSFFNLTQKVCFSFELNVIYLNDMKANDSRESVGCKSIYASHDSSHPAIYVVRRRCSFTAWDQNMAAVKRIE